MNFSKHFETGEDIDAYIENNRAPSRVPNYSRKSPDFGWAFGILIFVPS